MTQWEYCYINWTAVRYTDDQNEPNLKIVAHLQYCNDDQPPGKLGPGQLNQTIADLGRQGWELINIAVGGIEPTTEHYWFKRPIKST